LRTRILLADLVNRGRPSGFPLFGENVRFDRTGGKGSADMKERVAGRKKADQEARVGSKGR